MSNKGPDLFDRLEIFWRELVRYHVRLRGEERFTELRSAMNLEDLR